MTTHIGSGLGLFDAVVTPVSPPVPKNTPVRCPARHPSLSCPLRLQASVQGSWTTTQADRKKEFTMDTTRFDQIASTFAQSHSRRGAFHFLAATAHGVGRVTVI